MGGLFIASGTLSGTLVGFVAALPFPAVASAIGMEPPGLLAVSAVVGAGVGLDVIRLTAGKPAPPTSGRQVPQEWGRLLDQRVVAVLYGARLGVGPLTILSTWTWWSTLIAASLIGPWTGAAVGAGFGSVRLAVTVAASALASRAGDPAAHTAWFGRLRAGQRSNWTALSGAGALLIGLLVGLSVLAGCSTAGGQAAQPPAEDQPPRPSSTSPSTTVATVPLTATTAAASLAPSTTAQTIQARPAAQLDGQAPTEPTPPTVPVRLEDVVRTATTPATAPRPIEEGTAPVAPALLSTEPDALAASLPTELDGFTTIDDPMADRFLDLTAASQIQPDPTEEVALLETRGFAGGWTRAFRNDTNDVAVMSVYHFEDAAEAEFYLEDGLITIGGYGGKFFDIPALPGVRGFVQHFTEPGDQPGEADEELVSLGAAFQLGPRWHLIYLVGSTETVTADVLLPAITAVRHHAEQA
ncbi:MAG: hypothetical protein AAGA65_20685 [Actinomycetota bacterium]